MGISDEAPRGGLMEAVGGGNHSRPLVLRNAEIERFEDLHRGIFELWDGFFGRSPKPTSREVRNLIALGLVGGDTMTARAADDLIADLGPEHNPALYKIAQALLGVAFMPDAVDGGGDEPTPEDPNAKKSDPALGV